MDRTGPDICFIRLDFDSVQVSGPDLVFDFQLKKTLTFLKCLTCLFRLFFPDAGGEGRLQDRHLSVHVSTIWV